MSKKIHHRHRLLFSSVIGALLIIYFCAVGTWFVPLMTMLVILTTRNAILGLALGTALGAFALSNGLPGPAIQLMVSDYLFGALDGAWHVSAILFTLLLGAFSGILSAGGGFEALGSKLVGSAGNAPRRVESAAAGLGIACFFDGLANSLLVGQLGRPIFDKAGIPRARLAYFVDSTSSAVACISFISTWIAMQLSLIQAAITEAGSSASSYGLFFRSIPQNYYCWFTLMTVAAVIWRQWSIGPMRREQPHEPADEPPDAPENATLWAALIPLAALVLSIFATFYLWETAAILPVTAQKLVAAFGGNAGPYALVIGSLVGLAVAYAFVPASRRVAARIGARDGAAAMLLPLCILVLAWAFGSVLSDLGTAEWIADILLQSLPQTFLPLAIFLTGALISFSSGSSWGTMALLMPIALGGWNTIAPGDVAGMPTIIAAVFSGAVFGDHCSPFSDTTIVSSFASGVSTDTHVRTQTPYALFTAAVTAICGFGASALGLHPALCLLLGGTVITLCAVYFSARRQC